MVAFGVVFLAAYLVITELKSKLAETRPVVTFKRVTTRSQTSVLQLGDIETATITGANSDNDLRGDYVKVERSRT